MREIEIHVDSISNYPPGIGEAIGYLSTWGFDSHKVVKIYPDSSVGEYGLCAVYSDKGSNVVKYAIGAVYNKEAQRYTFHS